MSTSADIRLETTGLSDGVWTGILHGISKARRPPGVVALLDGQPLAALTIGPRPSEANCWDLRLALGPETLRDGTACVLFQLDGVTLGELVIRAGGAADDDLRAQLALLRAELDLVKRTLRDVLRDRQP